MPLALLQNFRSMSCTHRHTQGQGLGCQGSGAAIPPASLGQEGSLKGKTHRNPGQGLGTSCLQSAGCNGIVLTWEQRKRMGPCSTSLCLGATRVQDKASHPGMGWDTAQSPGAQKSRWMRQVTQRMGRQCMVPACCVVASATVSLVLSSVHREALTSLLSLSSSRKGLGEGRKISWELNQGLRELPGSRMSSGLMSDRSMHQLLLALVSSCHGPGISLGPEAWCDIRNTKETLLR